MKHTVMKEWCEEILYSAHVISIRQYLGWEWKKTLFKIKILPYAGVWQVFSGVFQQNQNLVRLVGEIQNPNSLLSTKISFTHQFIQCSTSS